MAKKETNATKSSNTKTTKTPADKSAIVDKLAKKAAEKAKAAEKKAAEKAERAKRARTLIQRSLVVLKPDTVQRGIIGEVIQRFERVGLKIVGMKMVMPSEDHYRVHYEDIGQMITRRGEEVFHYNVEYMMTGPVIAIVLEGVECVPLVRKIVGPTEPKSAEMGTIRGDFSHMSFGYSNAKGSGVPNLVHASGSVEEAKREIKLWFDEETELYDYSDLREKYTR